jgi:hypothetical protein
MVFMACSNCAFGKGCNAPTQVLLTYSEKIASSPEPILLCSSGGRTFLVSFYSWVNIEQHVGALDLILQSPSKRDKNVNLLVVNDKWHGYQPYTFGAADYVHGAMDSEFGEERTINIPHFPVQLIVDVIEVQVGAEKPDDLGKIHYRFHKLVLRISMKDSGQNVSMK